MASNETLSKIAAILCTIAESAPTGDPVPASPVYLALGMNMLEYTSLVNIMTSNGLIRATPSTLCLTLKGKKIADSILAEMELTDHGKHASFISAGDKVYRIEIRSVPQGLMPAVEEASE